MLWREVLYWEWVEELGCCSLMGEWPLRGVACSGPWSSTDGWTGCETGHGGRMPATGSSTVSGMTNVYFNVYKVNVSLDHGSLRVLLWIFVSLLALRCSFPVKFCSWIMWTSSASCCRTIIQYLSYFQWFTYELVACASGFVLNGKYESRLIPE